MKKSCLIIFGSVLSLSGIPSSNAALDCTAAPDCASLGYTMTAADCADGVKVACPTDTSKVFCKKDVIQSVTCAVGSILGGDQLCYKDKLPDGVKPVGIVFDTTNKLAVALTDINSSGSAGSTTMYWSSSYCDTSGLDNCTSSDGLTSCGVDGRTNTDAILASTCNGTTYAANGANAYAPSGCSADFCKAGQWFLPSMRDLITLYNAKSYVNASLSLTASSGAETLTENYYSSTEFSNYHAWTLHVGNGKRMFFGKNINDHHVRPVIYYGTTCQVANCKTCEAGKTDSCQTCNDGYMKLADFNTNKTTCTQQLSLPCQVLNCQTCVSGDSSTCKICKSGYTLQSGKCVSAGFVCELPSVQRTCNGMKCCCPQGVYCDSNYKCLCDSTSMGQGIVQ